jgi:hypothetical protein
MSHRARGVRALIVVVAAIALAGVAGTPAKATPFTPRVAPDSLGINAQFAANDNLFTITADQRRAHIAAIAAQGIKVVRVGPWWDDVQKDMPIPPITPRVLDWTKYDTLTSELAVNGIRIAPTLAYSATWASYNLSTKGPPRDDKDYADLVRDFTARYGRGGTFWSTHPTLPYLPTLTYEIWNEPNWRAYWDYPQCPLHDASLDPGPRRYADLFVAAQTAIKGVDPLATVIVGGLVAIIDPAEVPTIPDLCTPQAWLNGMKLKYPTLQVDGIGIHIYWYNAAGSLTGLRGVREVRRKIDDLGWTTNVPLYFNESGFRTRDSGFPEWDIPDATRGQYLAEVADRSLRSNCLVRQYMPHTWLTSEDLDDATDGGNDSEDYYGIANPHAAATDPPSAFPYGSAQAYGAMVRTLQGEGPTAPNAATEHLCEWRP